MDPDSGPVFTHAQHTDPQAPVLVALWQDAAIIGRVGGKSVSHKIHQRASGRYVVCHWARVYGDTSSSVSGATAPAQAHHRGNSVV